MKKNEEDDYDIDSEEVYYGEKGILFISSPSMTLGYFKNEEAKQNYIQNGFGNNGTTYSLENGTSSIPYYATSQQWVDAANANDGKGNFVKTDGGVYMPDLSNL